MSTTNDEQAKYGEREPMLSDEQLFSVCMQSVVEGPMILGEKTYGVNFGEDPAAYKVRKFYESLITTGKLRVVEECVVRTSNGDNWPLMQVLGCNGKGPVTDEVWCPYCGNKIKR